MDYRWLVLHSQFRPSRASQLLMIGRSVLRPEVACAALIPGRFIHLCLLLTRIDDLFLFTVTHQCSSGQCGRSCLMGFIAYPNSRAPAGRTFQLYFGSRSTSASCTHCRCQFQQGGPNGQKRIFQQMLRDLSLLPSPYLDGSLRRGFHHCSPSRLSTGHLIWPTNHEGPDAW